MGRKPKYHFSNPALAVPGPVNRSEPVRNVMPKSIFDSPVTSEAKSMSKSIFDPPQKEERPGQKSTIQNVGQKSNQANETQKSNTGIIEEALNHHFCRKKSSLTHTLSVNINDHFCFFSKIDYNDNHRNHILIRN